MIGNTMAAQRLRRKATWRGLGVGVAAAALIIPLIFVLPGAAATTEYVVVDHNSGLAINGFDPIAYFTERTALLGKGEFEYRYAGAVWRFRNQGNRDAFAAHPTVYLPRFGGYDPLGLARGVALPGDPRLWLIVGERLYLFNVPQNRAAFATQGDQAIAIAERQWPSVQLTLSP
jgi:hypothetical protein